MFCLNYSEEVFSASSCKGCCSVLVCNIDMVISGCILKDLFLFLLLSWFLNLRTNLGLRSGWVCHVNSFPPTTFSRVSLTAISAKLKFSASIFEFSPRGVHGVFYPFVDLPLQTTISITCFPGTNLKFLANPASSFRWRSSNWLTSNKKSLAMLWAEYYVS